MKRNSEFLYRQLAGQNVLIKVGSDALDFQGILTLNETGILLWDFLENDTDIDTLSKVLMDKYGIDEETAFSDVNTFIDCLRENGCLDE